ncbi:MAG: DUF1016 family protein [Verrucomicrobia bacterium]|nr:DUF1016 family protein [Verrucomicrobiota bacterium]
MSINSPHDRNAVTPCRFGNRSLAIGYRLFARGLSRRTHHCQPVQVLFDAGAGIGKSATPRLHRFTFEGDRLLAVKFRKALFNARLLEHWQDGEFVPEVLIAISKAGRFNVRDARADAALPAGNSRGKQFQPGRQLGREGPSGCRPQARLPGHARLLAPEPEITCAPLSPPITDANLCKRRLHKLTYLNAVDDRLWHPQDRPSIGLILCRRRDRNHLVLEYALRGLNKPIGVSQYELTRALPANLKPSLPTVEAIGAELARDLATTARTPKRRKGGRQGR